MRRLLPSIPENAVTVASERPERESYMKTRIITAVVAIAILLPVLIFSGSFLLPLALALCSVIAVFEMSSCIGIKKDLLLTLPTYLAAAVLPFCIRYSFSILELRQWSMALLCVFVLYCFAVLTFSKGKYKLGDVAIWFFVSIYILLGFNSILVLRDYKFVGKYVYLLVFIGAWVTDTFAYFCGMMFGKHKLIPEVSPKKTVEGSVGGMIFCILSFLLYGFIVQFIVSASVNYGLLAIAGLFISVISQLGDLCMSVIKRTYGVKDYGKLFPGHGGILDRFDSILAVSVILAVFCSFFNFFTLIQ